MWIFLPDAFFSVVSIAGKPGQVQVRARARVDLERHFPTEPIVHTPAADYHFRVIVDRSYFADWLAGVALMMDWTNVKAAIPIEDVERHDAMSMVWGAMHSFQTKMGESPARKRKRASSRGFLAHKLGDTLERTCVGCGCTDSLACPGGCHWLAVDAKTQTGVCSECPGKLKAFERDAGVRVKRAPILRTGKARR